MIVASGPELGFGGITLDGMNLAIPLHALQEVVPCTILHRLPAPAAYVIGGIDVRGTVVPVLDLRIAFGRPASPISAACVALMAHEGCMWGLLAESVNGIFFCPSERIRSMHCDDPLGALYSGSVCIEGVAGPISILSPAAVAAIPGVPKVTLATPTREDTIDADEEEAQISVAAPTMLIRCANTLLAVDAASVYTTMATPVLEVPRTAGGGWRGFMEIGGERVPVFDLKAILGLGECTDETPAQTFIMQVHSRLTAWLVDGVIDVIGVRPDEIFSVPRFALAHAHLILGILPHSREGTLDGSEGRYLVLNAEALANEPTVAALSAIQAAASPRGDARSVESKRTERGLGSSMMVYTLEGDVATPLEQIAEIMPFPPELVGCSSHEALMGIVTRRGRSIPILSLIALANLPCPLVPCECVLLVQSGGEWIGFAVPFLKSIETADSQPVIPAVGVSDGNPYGMCIDGRRLARIVTQGQQRLLPTVDLMRIAEMVRSPENGSNWLQAA